MSIALIENELRRFLATKDPEVMSLSGRWGVGKTFAWNKFLKDAHEARSVALERYAYVSLFGVGSLDELKYSIFENTVQSSEIGIEPSLETLRSNTTAVAERLGRRSFRFLERLPLVKNYVAGLGPVWFLSVKKTIICVDDIERRGKGLAIRDVMGLVLHLKEQKQCKVALILNEEAIEEDKRDFETYCEKVVDTSLKFAPTAEECSRIALARATPLGAALAEDCVALGISNIRLIMRIARSARKIEPLVRKFDEKVLRQAVQSLALLSWSVYEPNRAPTLEYLRRRNLAGLPWSDNEAIPESEAAWNALLDAYGFTAMDEFDLVLLDGVRYGFFDPVQVERRAAELDSKICASKRDSSFERAWSLYHDSFQNNQDEVLDAIYESFSRAVQSISPMNLSGTVTLFKELGRQAQAAEMIERYVSTHGENRCAFDLDNYPFASDIKDPDVIQVLKAKFATFRDEREPAEVLCAMTRKRGWSPNDISMLAAMSVDDYYGIFKRNEGSDLRDILQACLQFDPIVNASAPEKEISKRAKEALKRIGKESAINARRVRRYGVAADDAPPASPDPPE